MLVFVKARKVRTSIVLESSPSFLLHQFIFLGTGEEDFWVAFIVKVNLSSTRVCLIIAFNIQAEVRALTHQHLFVIMFIVPFLSLYTRSQESGCVLVIWFLLIRAELHHCEIIVAFLNLPSTWLDLVIIWGSWLEHILGRLLVALSIRSWRLIGLDIIETSQWLSLEVSQSFFLLLLLSR